MEIKEIINGVIDFSISWKQAEGSCLSNYHHQLLSEGKILCVERNDKIKFFVKKNGQTMSVCFPKRPLNTLIRDLFGEFSGVSNLVLEPKLESV